MPQRSAGILLYRQPAPQPPPEPAAAAGCPPVPAAIEVLLVHPGGPYWARRDDGWWSIPKGEIAEAEEALAAAEREVEEELGHRLTAGPRLPLGEVVQAGGKRVVAWAAEGDLDVATVRSGTFEIEWPPRSGQRRHFPEVDRAAWYGLADARRKILPGQAPFLDRLAALVTSTTAP